MSFELVDSQNLENKVEQTGLSIEEQEHLNLLKKYKFINVSSLDVLCYAYCYIGLFTGKI